MAWTHIQAKPVWVTFSTTTLNSHLSRFLFKWLDITSKILVTKKLPNNGKCDHTFRIEKSDVADNLTVLTIWFIEVLEGDDSSVELKIHLEQVELLELSQGIQPFYL